MTYRLLPAVVAATILGACGQAGDSSAERGTEAGAEAQRIAATAIIVDTHIDLPMRLAANPADISQAVDSGDFDRVRAQAGGLNVAFMSIYTPAELEAEERSRAAADTLIDGVEALVARHPEHFALAKSTADVRAQFDAGRISFPLGMENGAPIAGNLADIEYFYDRGIRYITLAHSLSNHISDSSYDQNRQWHGLSSFGEDVVREMNRLGIMVDVSHISDEAFWQVMDVTAVPAIASHSSARQFTPGWERNMSDDMIVRLAQNGGVIMVNFGSMFITQEAQQYSTGRSDASKAWKLEQGVDDDNKVRRRFYPIWEAEHGPFPYATLDEVLDHFDHIVALAGVEHVGIGSDYDGVGDALPIGLKDASAYPNLVDGLLRRGYSEADIRMILGENLLRVWRANEDYASALRGDEVDEDVPQ